MAERTVRDELCDWLLAVGVDPKRVPKDARATLLPCWIVVDTYRHGPSGKGILLYRDRRGERHPCRQKTVVRRTVEPPPIVARWIAGEVTEQELWMPLRVVEHG